MSQAPEGWVQTTLGEVGSWGSGGTPSRANSKYFGLGIPWIKSGDLPDGPILRIQEQITELGLKNSAAKIFPAGAVSLALYGATIGRLGILTFPAATNQACANIVPNLRIIDGNYLFYYLFAQRRQFIELGQGGAQPNISQQIVRKYVISLAPLPEQHRIVAKLKLLLDRVSVSRDRLAAVETTLKRFRQAVTSAALSGKLSTDWRKAKQPLESRSITQTLYERRLAGASTKAQRERVAAIFEQSEDKDSNELPKGWRFTRLSKLAESFDYGTSAKSQPTGEVPVLRMGNIQDGRIDWTDLVYTSDADEIRSFQLKPSTVLFNRTNSPELVGKTAIYRGDKPAIFAGYLIRINAAPELDPEYLNLFLNSPAAREFCRIVKTDGVSQSNINAQKLGEFEIPFCQIGEQREIVRRTKALFAFADRLGSRLKKATSQVEQLTQSILAKAFRGELVPTEAELADVEGRTFKSAEQFLKDLRDSVNSSSDDAHVDKIKIRRAKRVS